MVPCSPLMAGLFNTTKVHQFYIYDVSTKVIHYRSDEIITMLTKLFIKQNEVFLVVVRFEDPIMILGPTNYSTVTLNRRFYM